MNLVILLKPESFCLYQQNFNLYRNKKLNTQEIYGLTMVEWLHVQRNL